MGEQMTREQIEAWLALEGWEPHDTQHGFARYVASGRKGVWLNFDKGPNCTADFWPNDTGPKATYEIFKTHELQLIYQEIIKHEKD